MPQGSQIAAPRLFHASTAHTHGTVCTYAPMYGRSDLHKISLTRLSWGLSRRPVSRPSTAHESLPTALTDHTRCVMNQVQRACAPSMGVEKVIPPRMGLGAAIMLQHACKHNSDNTHRRARGWQDVKMAISQIARRRM